MKFIVYSLTIVLFAGVFTSCVPSRKYHDLEDSKARTDRQYRDTLNVYKQTKESLAAERRKTNDLDDKLGELNRKYKELSSSYDQSQKLNKDLNELYEKVIAQNKQLTSKATEESLSASQQVAELRSELRKQQMALDEKDLNLRKKEQDMKDREGEIKDRESQIKDREERIKKLEGDKGTLEKDLVEREKRIQELESLLSAQKEKAEELRNKIRQTLKSFSSNDLTVEEKDGKVYISLSQKLLFATGSKAIDKKGKEALAKLAEVLNKNTETSIMIEGHTDSDGDDDLNWELSAGRSISVLFELTRNGVDPKRITAAGRGEHQPISPNTTTEGKAQNRRTVIILSPDLTELYDLINNN